jgi:hypothetical protein
MPIPAAILAIQLSQSYCGHFANRISTIAKVAATHGELATKPAVFDRYVRILTHLIFFRRRFTGMRDASALTHS